MKILSVVVITLLILLAAFLIFIYSGWYNVSAMNDESGFIKWIFKTLRNNSVDTRLTNISVPDLNDSSLIQEGFEHYNEMCVSCHGLPGNEGTELSKGLNPRAPYLPKIAKYIEPAKLFWVTKYGIKMSGMPAWGKTHSDQKIWAIVAFTTKLPDLTAEEYRKMESDSGSMSTNLDPEHSQGEVNHH